MILRSGPESAASGAFMAQRIPRVGHDAAPFLDVSGGLSDLQHRKDCLGCFKVLPEVGSHKIRLNRTPWPHSRLALYHQLRDPLPDPISSILCIEGGRHGRERPYGDDFESPLVQVG